MKTYPGLQIGAFKDPEEREQIKIIDSQMRQFNAALAKSIFPGQLPAANPTPSPPSPGGGTDLPTPVRGDMLFSAGGNVWSRLSIGAANALLYSDGTVPIWSTTPPLLANYLYLPGRVGGQTLTWIDAAFPAFKIQGGGGFAAGSTFVDFRENGGLGLQLKNASGTNPTAIITGIFQVFANSSSITVSPTSTKIDVSVANATYIDATAAPIRTYLKPHGLVSTGPTATPVTNAAVETSGTAADYWVSIQVDVTTLQVGASCQLTLNWNNGVSARTFRMTVPLDTLTEQNRMLALTVGPATNLTYTTVYTGVTTGRVNIKIKAQRVNAT